MKSQIFAAAALVTAGILSSANAADLPMPAPAYSAPPMPVYNWTGCYVGGGGGYAFWQQDSFATLGGVPVTASESNGGKGWFGQGQVGCDYQFRLPLGSIFGASLFSGLSPEVVIGAFGDFEGGNINGSNSIPGLGLTGKRARIVDLGGWWSGRRTGHAAFSHLLRRRLYPGSL
jgi:outer membrane immunogenic protein